MSASPRPSRSYLIAGLIALSSAPAWSQPVDQAANQAAGGEHHAHDQHDTQQAHGSDNHDAELEHLTVVADPLGGSVLEITRPVDLLAGEYLDDRRGVTLGETLQWQPGVQSTYFGPGASRPIIRGLGGVRVRTLENSVSSLDAAALSDDHAVAIEPLLVDQIEILKGPATLLYGSGAIGGVVNTVDGRIAEDVVEPGIHGAVELRGNTVANERAGVFRLDSGHGLFNWHVDGFARDGDNYEIPGFALSPTLRAALSPDERAELKRGTLENSAVESSGGTAGFSFTGEFGFFGASFQRFDTEYGIPAELEAEAGDDTETEGADDGVSIDLRRNRIDVRGGLNQPLPGIEKLTLKFADNDYRHLELEGDEVGTRFDINAQEWRAEAVHVPWGNLHGVFGVQSSNEEVIATGEEAYIPATDTESLGVFFIEEISLGAWKFNAGARWENTDIDNLDSGQSRDFDNVSFSSGLSWALAPQWQAAFNYSRSERAATQAELFANGVHVANQSFEVGDFGLGEETANNFDLSLHKHLGAFHARVNLFYTQFDDFIYLANTGTIDDGFPVRIYSQEDADFYGLEAELGYRFKPGTAGSFELSAQFDTVEAELDLDQSANDQLPRISPTRIGMALDWHRGPWRARVDFLHVTKVNDVADFETRTPSYNLLGADLAYDLELGSSDWELYLKGENLLDETARVHTSFLKDFSPLPGVNLGFGLRGHF